MSMHKKPLTELEHAGLKAHGLDIGTPSQLSDVFRQGIAFALANAPTVQREGWVSVPIEPTEEMERAGAEKGFICDWQSLKAEIQFLHLQLGAADGLLEALFDISRLGDVDINIKVARLLASDAIDTYESKRVKG